MRVPMFKQSLVVTLVVILALLQLGVAHMYAKPHTSSSRIMSAVRKVQQAKTKTDALAEAESLNKLVRELGTSDVDDRTLHSIASLLDIPNDGVRYWVAWSLGLFGARAKFAVPKLLEILKVADCYVADVSSSMTIRPALERIGVTPPAWKCEKYILVERTP